MKLFVYRPKGHGSYSFAVVAESEEAAWTLADTHVKEKYALSDYVSPRFACEASGWGTDYYELETYDVGVIMEHENS